MAARCLVTVPSLVSLSCCASFCLPVVACPLSRRASRKGCIPCRGGGGGDRVVAGCSLGSGGS
eukprot:7415752-Pyramimonas_sp.AAC.1